MSVFDLLSKYLLGMDMVVAGIKVLMQSSPRLNFLHFLIPMTKYHYFKKNNQNQKQSKVNSQLTVNIYREISE